MERLTVVRIVAIVLSLALGIALLLVRKRVALPAEGEDTKQAKRKRRLPTILGVFFLWLCCGLIIGIFAEPAGDLHVEMFAPRVEIGRFSISSSVVIGWIAMAIILIPAVLIRIFAIPKFSDKPKGIQLLLETAVDYVSDYAKEKTGFRSEPLNAYMLTLALFLTACGAVELFSFRPPTADIVTTLSLALVTFIMINYFGIKRKGVGGRIKSLASPTPIVFPFRLLSDIAIPVSLACRLFGNMLGGMIVVHLVYMALGSFGVGIPAVLGLYFNVFHPLIQVYIFITLSLTFIGEAAE